MIDLLLEVYNYLIKPRLQNLEGHRVSLKEKTERERKKRKSCFENDGMYWSPGCAYHVAVTAAEFVGDLFCSLHHIFKQPCRKQIADNLFYVLVEFRSIISISFHGRKKIYRSGQETTHLMTYFYTTVHTPTYTTSPLLSCKQTRTQQQALSLLDTQRVTLFSARVSRLDCYYRISR